MQKFDSSNTLFKLASDLVNHTSRHIFLTGKAGTGKTTFLKYIKENCPKQMAIVAPTGVAAINAGGVTIHSFFQLPFSPFVPEARGFVGDGEEVSNKHTLLSRLRLNNERRKVFQELELLVIDEISMVRCDVLDAIDLVLRHVRHRASERFGGVQLLFIGDMFQLPPVVKEHEWNLLRDYYNSPYFFDSHVVREEPPVYMEFTQIYRQTDQGFIDLLNKVRNNEMEEEDLQALHFRYKPEFFGQVSDASILLTTHNEKAREINAAELGKLQGKLFSYKAEVKDDFPSNAFPADEVLQLKVGAQVMFIKNDVEKGKRYFNGKIGVVTELTHDKIIVRCKDEPEPIEVGKETWDNIRYTLDKATRNLNEDVLGSFSQYPLRLAWAITIHKSQGLTFEKVVIDAGKAFAPGQVYVALSRCTNLEGLVLHSQVRPNSFYTDPRIIQFTKSALPLDSLEKELIAAKKAYQEKTLSSLFDFNKAINSLKELQSYLLEHRSSFNTEVFAWTDELFNKIESLQSTSDKFLPQLRKLFSLAENAEDNAELADRISAAAKWFTNELRGINEYILQSPGVTDSSMHAKEYNELVKEIFTHISFQAFMLQGFSGKFDMELFHRRKKLFTVPSFGVNAYAGASEKKVELEHPALFYQLKKLRDTICAKKNSPIYMVASSKTLEEMANYLPQTLDQLEQISGFGKAKVASYGADFLHIINEYCAENNLSSNIKAKTPKRKRKEPKAIKTDTKAESFNLYREGKTIAEIAQQRNLSVQTIEGHLTYYVQQGSLKVEDLVSREKIVLIEPIAREFATESLTALKGKLGSEVSFGEIRLVLASIEHQKSAAHINQ